MSRRHNCPKRGRRSKSHYKDRLARRGLRSTDVLMEDVETLRARQSRRPMADPEIDRLGKPMYDLGAVRPLAGRRP